MSFKFNETRTRTFLRTTGSVWDVRDKWDWVEEVSDLLVSVGEFKRKSILSDRNLLPLVSLVFHRYIKITEVQSCLQGWTRGLFL